MNGRPWDEAELTVLREYFPHVPTRILACAFERLTIVVAHKANKLGLYKSAAFLASGKSGRIQRGRLHPAMVATQFPKGNVPVNKGVRQPGWAPGRMAETQFKPGRAACEAYNYVPIGTEKIDPKRKVLMRKMTDDPSIYPVKRWTPVHVLVWTAANGPVPPGHIVIFRRGMKTFAAAEITLDRLELVSFQENMRRNTVHNLPEPLPQLVHLRAVLNRKINRLERDREKQD